MAGAYHKSAFAGAYKVEYFLAIFFFVLELFGSQLAHAGHEAHVLVHSVAFAAFEVGEEVNLARLGRFNKEQLGRS